MKNDTLVLVLETLPEHLLNTFQTNDVVWQICHV